jgi:TPR repeat protein
MPKTKPSLIVLSLLFVSLCQPTSSQATGSNQPPSSLSVEERAENGDAEAQDEMGVDANEAHHYDKGFKWFQLAATQGLSKSQVSLGYAYDMGLGVEKDQVQAVHWYALAAAQGNPHAEFDLGMCYHHGEGVQSDNVEQNRAAAIKWFSLALSHGYESGADDLGTVYEHSSKPDYDEAFRWSDSPS